MKTVFGKLFVVGMVTLAVTGPLSAQAGEATIDLTGQWELTRAGGGGPRGGGRAGRGGGPSVLTLVQDGDTLTGTIEQRFGATDIQEGTINGNQISFKVVREFQDRRIEQVFTGTIEGDTISGTVSGGPGGRGGGEWTAKRVETS